MNSKVVKIIGWIISGLLAALFAFSAFGKLSAPQEMLDMFASMGLADWRVIIAAGEIGSLLLFLIPRTQSLGTLLLSSYMGGAIIVHMQGGEPFIFQAAVLIAVWVASVMRNPQTLSSFMGKPQAG